MNNDKFTLAAPSPRNREIFTQVRTNRRSYDAVAQEYQLSKGRISAIVKQVEKWTAATGGSMQGTTWQDRLVVMEEIHRQRLDQFFDKAMAGWSKSQQDHRTERVTVVVGKPDVRVITTKSAAGDSRFLCTALKVEEARIKFEDSREPIIPKSEQGTTPAQPAAETDEQIYWQPWRQEPEKIAETKAKYHAYAEKHGLPYPTTHIEKVKMECRMTDEWRRNDEEERARAAEGAGVGEGELIPSWRIPATQLVESAHQSQPLSQPSSQSAPSPAAAAQPQPSPSPAKRVKYQMSWFTPIVESENRKRALIHPSLRPPRKYPPGWEESSEVVRVW